MQWKGILQASQPQQSRTHAIYIQRQALTRETKEEMPRKHYSAREITPSCIMDLEGERSTLLYTPVLPIRSWSGDGSRSDDDIAQASLVGRENDA